jgi:hypothetical protein
MTPGEKLAQKSDDQKQAQAEARAAALALANDFKEVFGIPRSRSEAQDRVLAHLREKAGGPGSAFRPQGEGDGVKILIAGIQRDGARSVMDVIQYQLDQATKKPKPVKAKVAVKR